SSLAIALALQELHGEAAHLLACDVSEEWTSQARRYWDLAGVGRLIDLELAPAETTLRRKISQGLPGDYDFAFIDADKTGYGAYYEYCLKLLRVGGIMVFDNMLWGGDVADPAATSADTQALRALAQKAKADPRVDLAFTSVGDGLLICLKRPTSAAVFMP
ncbi:MAG: class I SAM-dependent methyltransferase, partial [Hyphomonadaceae bacterium]|nr:class I SAM-dependent methyltransferase [Hyphomonadaceae bacterium]